MMFGRSVNSAKFSGEHLKERQTGATSSTVWANILLATLKVKSPSQTVCSVAPGKERQSSRSSSICMTTCSASLLICGPGHAVHAGSQIDRGLQLPRVQIQNLDLSRREERDVRDATVGPHENFAEGSRGVEGLSQLACFQVDRENVTLQAGRHQPPAIGCGLGTID